MVPPVVLEVKEKKQKLTERWHLVGDTPERDLFVVDELTIRKACAQWPWAYFLLRDVPGGRLFLASIVELVSIERVRVDRVGPSGHRKGKHIYDVRQFREIDGLDNLEDLIREDIVSQPWKRSEALSLVPVRTV